MMWNIDPQPADFFPTPTNLKASIQFDRWKKHKSEVDWDSVSLPVDSVDQLWEIVESERERIRQLFPGFGMRFMLFNSHGCLIQLIAFSKWYSITVWGTKPSEPSYSPFVFEIRNPNPTYKSAIQYLGDGDGDAIDGTRLIPIEPARSAVNYWLLANTMLVCMDPRMETIWNDVIQAHSEDLAE